MSLSVLKIFSFAIFLPVTKHSRWHNKLKALISKTTKGVRIPENFLWKYDYTWNKFRLFKFRRFAI